ncbi:MAG: L,D-transpeptidase/peptidoglycan binding protein [Lachnospiraceae bacterium]|nr:L,D-transpeptidase/peptidoglycan binding protein [Lachnospiraceae bacterium]
MKTKFILVFFAFLLLAGIFTGGYHFYRHYAQQPAFLEGTQIDGESVEGKTPEELARKYTGILDTSTKKVEILEGKDPVLSGSLYEFGYECDELAVKAFFVREKYEQIRNIFTIIKALTAGTNIEFKKAYTFNQESFEKMVSSRSLSVERVETKDWELIIPEGSRLYELIGGTKGNMIDEEAFRIYVKESLDDVIAEGTIPDQLSLTIPEEVYISKEPVGDPEALKAERDSKNHVLRMKYAIEDYQASSITYEFGSEIQLLDFDTFGSWLSVGEDYQVSVDQEAAMEYVIGLKRKYDTQYYSRTFKTSNGLEIVFPEGLCEYGYRINQQAEFEQLLADLDAKKAVTREPVYVRTNEYGNPYFLARNGKDDICGTYIEVNITKQHLWFYKDGRLVVESDVVTGRVSSQKETQTGVFPLAFKQSPRVLTGEEAGGSGTYSTKVNYWMAFYEGQGLHDAPWRGAFGGNIYQTGGSHGCVNLPPAVAKTIYENVEVGTAIFLYKEPEPAAAAGTAGTGTAA